MRRKMFNRIFPSKVSSWKLSAGLFSVWGVASLHARDSEAWISDWFSWKLVFATAGQRRSSPLIPATLRIVYVKDLNCSSSTQSYYWQLFQWATRLCSALVVCRVLQEGFIVCWPHNATALHPERERRRRPTRRDLAPTRWRSCALSTQQWLGLSWFQPQPSSLLHRKTQ